MAEEMTNQSVSETEDDGFLSDELNEAAGNSEGQKPESNENSEGSTQPESFLNIRYNGQDKALSEDEARTLAQKGMNYDKMYSRLQEIQNSPVLKTITEQANRAGLSLEEYANRLQQFNQQAAINEIANEFKAKNPDATDDMAEQYAQMAYQNQLYQQAAQERQKSQAEREAESNRYIKEVQDFQERYPDVKVDALPNDVIDDINSGTPLETAYDRYLIREYQKRISNQETNTKNQKNNTSNLSSNSSSQASDPFLEGLLGS